MSGEFRLAIRLANAEMRTSADVAEALIHVAGAIHNTDRSTGPILDGNGNTVGDWGAEWPQDAADASEALMHNPDLYDANAEQSGRDTWELDHPGGLDDEDDEDDE
jgi:hypothetical protein